MNNPWVFNFQSHQRGPASIEQKKERKRKKPPNGGSACQAKEKKDELAPKTGASTVQALIKSEIK